MLHRPRLRSVLCLPLLVSAAAHAQAVEYRVSKLGYLGGFGGGEDWEGFSSATEWTTPLLSDERAISVAESGDGLVLKDPDRPWSGAIALEMGHEYVITGTVKQFSRIEANGSLEASAGATGEGIAQMLVPTEGNLLEFGFTLAEATDARLTGNVSIDPDKLSSTVVTLYHFNGFSWVSIFSTYFIPSQEGDFDFSQKLGPGLYSLYTFCSGSAIAPGDPSQVSSWSYRLELGSAPACPSDLDGSGEVDALDLAALLSAWGPCGASACPADVNQDAAVDALDLAALLSAWGVCP